MNDFSRAACACLILTAALCMSMSDARAQTDGACNPVIPAITIPAAGKSVGSENKLRALFEEDQLDRSELERAGISAWPKVQAHDVEHRRAVLEMLGKAEVVSGAEMYLAAFMFQHGSCSDDYALTRRLAEEAIHRGSKDAKWLYAASTDRYLVSRHLPQKFGTQFGLENGRQRLLPLDKTTTDAERRKYNVPPLIELLKEEK